MRNSVGYDIDPLSVFVTKAKLGAIGRSRIELERYRDRLLTRLASYNSRRNYDDLMFRDISRLNGAVRKLGFDASSADLISRWFRKYVIQDLAVILGVVHEAKAPLVLKHLALLAFAATLRSCSNADPVPVSGLEYTKRMRQLDRDGRRIDPFALYQRKLANVISQASQFSEAADRRHRHVTYQHDSTQPWPLNESYDLIFFSPPYLNAVEYSRRHKLEMAWLKLVNSHEQFVELANQYVGHRASGSEAIEDVPFGASYIDRIRRKLLDVDYRRARAFIKYCHQMHTFFLSARERMNRGSHLVIVVGDNTTAGVKISSSHVMAALASPLRLKAQHTYQLRNRYMTYSRRNGADIASERILVLTP